MADEFFVPKKRPLREFWLHIRLNQSERQEIDAIAGEYGLARSELARQFIMQSVERFKNSRNKTSEKSEHNSDS